MPRSCRARVGKATHGYGVAHNELMAAPPDLAHRLLDAHVAFHVQELRGPGFAALVEREIDHALADAARLTLAQVITREQVKAVAGKYVARFDLPGAIPDVVGEIAMRVRSHPANDVALGEVLPRRHVAAAANKIGELRAVREWLAVQITESPERAGMAGRLPALAHGRRRRFEPAPGEEGPGRLARALARRQARGRRST